MKNVVIFGFKGALGRSVEKTFISSGWRGFGIDLNVASRPSSPGNHPGLIPVASPEEVPAEAQVDAVICVAGGFEMDKVHQDPLSNPEWLTQYNRLWNANVEPSLQAADFATKRQSAALILTGSRVVHEQGTSGAQAYGMCKTVVHHLSLKQFADKRVPGRRVVCILPTMLDTPANRAGMPKADFSKWTPTDSVASLIVELCTGKTPAGYNPQSVFFKL